MSASTPLADRRPIPAVAIIGNDAVLAAAPATPVQLAHACLRRGFTVAVPASWGDELVAADAVRCLATRDRGPAVMCVCPFVRSRLLAPGPDLAAFLVSLVSPPVATARYLRAVYGERGVHITYIGGCPSADDSTIDARLTPDAFLADIAEHGIALSEQPLVFDSIVPPDRRRWCSLPGGAPSPEILWNDTDTRTLVEIDRDDISTDLAQHIITREHVLLDLAPSLGCVCSGAISALSPRSARVAVTALEPPRAFRAVIDVPPGVSLDVPIPQLRHAPPQTPQAVTVAEPSRPANVSDPEPVASRLDEVLETELGQAPIAIDAIELEAELEAELDSDLAPAVSPIVSEEPPEARETDTPALESLRPDVFFQRDVMVASDVLVESTVSIEPEVNVETRVGAERTSVEFETTAHAQSSISATGVAIDSAPVVTREPEVIAASEPTTTPAPAVVDSPVRRRTPVPMPARHPASSIPRATASDGRALPRAYVAKRRTPPHGAGIVEEQSRPVESAQPSAAHPELSRERPSEALPSATGPENLVAPKAPTASSEAPRTHVPTPPPEAASAPPVESSIHPEASRARAAVATPESNPSALVVLLVALLALGFFVLRSLN